MWVGKDEHQGVRAQARKDVPPPPHWRLEAVAATPRPHSVTVGADRRQAVFVQDADFSEVWALDLEAPGAAPERLTAGRALANWWESAPPRLSPDGSQVAYVDGEHVHLAPVAGGPARRLVAGDEPCWVDDTTLVIAVERDDETRLAVVDTRDPWPRRLAADGAKGDESQAAASPDGTEVAYTFVPRDDLARSEIRVASVRTGEWRAVTGTPGLRDREPAWSPDGGTIAYASERSGFYELYLVGRDGGGDRRLTGAGADHGGLDWHPDGHRILAARTLRGRTDLVALDGRTGEAELLAPGGQWSAAHWTAGGGVIAAYEDHRTPPELRLAAPGDAPATRHAPAPRPARRAPHAALEEVTYRSFDGLEIHAFLLRPRGASAERPVPAVVCPHGGPIDFAGDLWDGEAQYFVDKGYAWLAPNFRGSASYGRAFEYGNHGFWGVGDTQDCVAAADHLRALDWVRGDRIGIFGASYGSYMALSAVADDREGRFRCAVCKYGDCDLVTSWAQGDRSGVQELEMMMGTPGSAPGAYRAASPFHRLAAIDVPILVATGELDRRVSPEQSAQLVAELRRLGKTFEYVTYPTEAHGLLRVAPFLDFYSRLERFLDWHLM
jgi:dipeptidyl aminopeptidase/acylaminoacyl peptidase